MADGAANADQGRHRRRARAAADGERSVRQRLDDMETRMDATEALYRSQDTRLLYLEAYTKVVLRGFSSVGDFLKDKERDFKLAKQAFIAAFVHEFRDKAFAEATHVLEEAETLLCENNGVMVVGIFPTGATTALTLMVCCGCKPHGLAVVSPTCLQLQGSIFRSPIKCFRIAFGATRERRVAAKARTRTAKGMARGSSNLLRPNGQRPRLTHRVRMRWS